MRRVSEPTVARLSQYLRLLEELEAEGVRTVSSGELARRGGVTAAQVRKVLANYTEAEDLINIGAYQQGSNPDIDYALRYIGKVREFLQQGKMEGCPLEQTIQRMKALFTE